MLRQKEGNCLRRNERFERRNEENVRQNEGNVTKKRGKYNYEMREL